MKMINYTEHTITEEDIKAVSDVLANEQIAGNTEIVRKFEDALCHITGYKFCLATSSATTALLVAYRSIWEETDMLTVGSLTFVATVNTLLSAGHQATLIDINLPSRVTHGVDVGISFGGHPVARCTLADDAHSLIQGMVESGNKTSVLSFHPAKIITTGEGGAILTNEERVYINAQRLVDQGRLDRQGSFGYGFNFRMSGLNAALGLSQLGRLSENHARRRFIAAQYRKELQKFDQYIILPKHHHMHSYHLFNVVFQEKSHRDELRSYLLEQGIGTQVHYPPLPDYPHLARRFNLSGSTNARIVYERGLSLPMHLNITLEQLDFILEQLVFFLNRLYG